MQVHVEETKKLRRASASIRDGGIIHVKVPRHWPRDMKRSAIDELVSRLQRKNAQEKALLAKAAHQERVTITSQPELEQYVRQINAETFKVPLGKVQIGYSRYNHLAQVNLRTKTMTVSKYCLHHAPADALRYLIIHELAHYFESGHGPKFWALVGRHVPDYRLQSRIMKAFHHQTVIEAEKAEEANPTLEAAGERPNPDSQTDPKPKSRYASKPRGSLAPGLDKKPTRNGKAGNGTGQQQGKLGKTNRDSSRDSSKIPPRQPLASPKTLPENDKTGLIPGFVKQLKLWMSP